MKMKYIIIVLLVIIFIIGIVFVIKKKNESDYIKKIENGELTSLYLSYSKGYMMNANIRYDFKYDRDSNKYIAIIKPYLIADEDALEVEVDNNFKDKLKEVIVKYKVAKWDGFSESDQNVLDGDSFSFGAWFEDKTNIHASGYMMWPDNYSNVRNELDNIFMDIYNKEKGNNNE